MKLVKVLCTLILLLISSSSYSFFIADPVGGERELGYLLPSEVSEDSNFSFEGRLATSIPFQKVSFSAAHINFILTKCSLREKFKKEGISYSKSGDPNFTIRDIIYPFHSFL